MSYWINTESASKIEFTIGPFTFEQEIREINGVNSSTAVKDGDSVHYNYIKINTIKII